MRCARSKTSLSDANQRIFTRDFVLLFVANFVVVSVYFLLMTTMAHYAVTAYGVDDSIAGLTASIFLVGGVLGRIVTGRYGMYWGLERMSIASIAVSFAACALYLFDGWDIGALIGIRLLHGLAFGVANTVVPALAVDTLPHDRMGEGTGYFMLSNSLGVGVGPLISLITVMGVDYAVLFVVCTVLTALALGCALTVGRHGDDPAAAVVHERGPKPGAFTIGSIIDLSTVKLSFFMFLVALSYSSLNSFVNSYAIEQGMGSFSPFVFLVYSVVLLLTRPLTGKLMDRFGENAILYPSIISMAAGLVLAAFATTPPALLACGIFMATGFGTCMSTGQAAATKLTTSGNTALAISTFFLLCDGGCGVGPFFLGMVVSAAGYRTMYLLCACIALVAVAYYHLTHGRATSRERRLSHAQA